MPGPHPAGTYHPVNRFYKRIGPESAGPVPWFQPPLLIRDEIAMIHQLVSFQTPQAFGKEGFHRCHRFVHWLPLSILFPIAQCHHQADERGGAATDEHPDCFVRGRAREEPGNVGTKGVRGVDSKDQKYYTANKEG